MSNYKYLSDTVVAKIDDDGKSRQSCSVDNEEFKEWVEEGNTPEAADVPPDPTYKELRAAEYNLKTTGEQFGMQYDDAQNGTTTWVDWQTEIKVRIPE